MHPCCVVCWSGWADADPGATWKPLRSSGEFRAFVEARHPSLAPMLAAPGRRRLLQIMAASFALGGLGSCDRPSSTGRSQIIPYVKQPGGLTPGVPLSYASATLLDGIANGVLVTTMDGRPIKLEGNAEHPWSRGGTDIFVQAHVLGLYDPDRSQSVQHAGNPSDWDSFRAAMLGRFAALQDAGGQGLHLLTGPVSSPSLIAQIEAVRQAMPQMHWHSHAPVGRDALYAGAQQAFGKPLETRWNFHQAEVIVSLDGDFLDPGPQQVGASLAWIDARRKLAASGRLLEMHAVAPTPTLTSAKAEHHRPVAQRDLLPLAQALLAQLEGGADKDAPLASWRNTVTQALRNAPGRSIVLAGMQQSPALHAIVHRINAVLGNLGKTVLYTDPVLAQTEPFGDLIAAMRRGEVSTLVMLESNPVYTAPADVGFDRLLAQVPLKLHASLHVDETAVRCDWHLPQSHPLESWGDARALDGTATLIQPTIERLYDTRSCQEILSLLVDDKPRAGYAIVQDFWRSHMSGEDFNARWQEALRGGFVSGSAFPMRDVQPPQASPQPQSAAADAAPEVLIRPDPTIWDGCFANNAWLQELPKPLTKIVWDNIVALPPNLASQHGLKNGDITAVHVGAEWIAGPAWIIPGQHEDSIVLYLGYGRTHAGSVGQGIGYNAYALRRLDAPWVLGTGKLHAGGDARAIAETQQIDDEEGHDYIRLQPIDARPVGDDTAWTQPTLYQRDPSDGRAWGMVIDLDACTGCNACVVACQAENNVPVVGKDQVLAGRDMHWLRIDRYRTGAESNPDTRFMPVPCMHCETAPCELGCPVEATLHDSEGLNLMVYNRCIGTRACNAYCPYKVRHFNYLHYSDAPDSIQAQRNPDVTVRARGVMEKCTYCVQRIVAGRVASAKEDRPIRDGEVVTACAAACPTRAIQFGDLADQGSVVAAARKNPRNYALLGELNTRPRTTYLAALVPERQEGMSMPNEAVARGKAGFLAGENAESAIVARIADIAFAHPSARRWFIAFGISVLLALWLVVALGWLFYWGIGVWGNNIPVGWALDIVSYDWWMANACGALIVSALLLLLRQHWRGALNRSAEAIAVLAAATAGVYPIIHLGRPWFFFWNLPYPNTLLLWPQFRSPLVWDAFDIISLLVIAVLFWYVGMIPDLATLRDRATTLHRKQIYGVAALGWRGSALHWARWLQAYRILALFGLLQAVVTQCGAAVMYAGTVEPGWHDTLLPVFFIVNSVFSGAGAIAVVVAVVRYIYPTDSLITSQHLDLLSRLILAAGLLSTYCYCAEFFFTALGGDVHDRAVMMRRFTGLYASSFWLIVGAALLPIHLLWFRAIRRSAFMLFGLGLLVMAGMWSDHFMVLVITQHHDFLPSSQATYAVSFWGITTWTGTIGLFGMLLLLALRYVPVASIVDLRLHARRDLEVPRRG